MEAEIIDQQAVIQDDQNQLMTLQTTYYMVQMQIYQQGCSCGGASAQAPAPMGTSEAKEILPQIMGVEIGMPLTAELVERITATLLYQRAKIKKLDERKTQQG